MTGNHLFVISATCSVFSCFAVSDCLASFQSFVQHFVLVFVGSRPTSQFCTHEMSFVCFVTDKGSSLRLFLAIIIFLTLLSVTIQEERKNHYSFCGFLSSVCCIPSRTVHRERTVSTATKWQRSVWFCCLRRTRRGSCRAQVPRVSGYCLSITNNVNDK